ncbi:MAG: putative ABC transporter permease [Lachnospiraceae bacterium]|nr:putative ABC transporter permease [Lachnospiraceae bacterium]
MWRQIIFNVDFYHLFYVFIIYSFLGWIMETTFVSVKGKKFVNRGFMSGPFCPIYGTGASLFYVFLTPMGNNYALVFICGMTLATIVEYLTSVLLELIFNAKWWDYSQRRYNIKGRICLSISLCWGFLSIIMLEILQPAALRLIDKMPLKFGEIFGYFIIAYIISDVTVTVCNIIKFNNKIKSIAEIRENIKERFANTQLYENISEIKLKYDFSESKLLLEHLKQKVEEKAEGAKGLVLNKQKLLDSLDRLEIDFNDSIAKNKKMFDSFNAVEKRLIKAFPSLKSHYTKDELIKEIRNHISASRNKKK